ncbi:hypothetical protein ACFL96_14410 [Thermoproteota archaeon]
MMKVIHIETKAKIEKIEFDASALPDTIGLVTTIQFIDASCACISYHAPQQEKDVQSQIIDTDI